MELCPLGRRRRRRFRVGRAGVDIVSTASGRGHRARVLRGAIDAGRRASCPRDELGRRASGEVERVFRASAAADQFAIDAGESKASVPMDVSGRSGRNLRCQKSTCLTEHSYARRATRARGQSSAARASRVAERAK